MDVLYVVIPAYNEEDNIEAVVSSWYQIVKKVGENSRLLIIDDGSKDSTYQILKRLSNTLSQLIVITKDNSGHGSTLLFGYKYALKAGADFIFQTDSDGQTDPKEFWPFWENREKFDYQIGYRKHRQDGFRRIVVTKMLKVILFSIFHEWITDANTPFRLMSASTLCEHIQFVPNDYNLSNVLLSVLYQKSGQPGCYPEITFLPRQGGVNKINMMKIFKIGMGAIKDLVSLRKSIKQLA